MTDPLKELQGDERSHKEVMTAFVEESRGQDTMLFIKAHRGQIFLGMKTKEGDKHHVALQAFDVAAGLQIEKALHACIDTVLVARGFKA